jgi:hypothetical protein
MEENAETRPNDKVAILPAKIPTATCPKGVFAYIKAIMPEPMSHKK